MRTDSRNRGRRLGWAIGITIVTVGWWIGTAWAARQTRPSLIRASSGAFVLALVWTYVAVSSIAMARARDVRRTVFRIIALTVSLVGGLLVLEAPAVLNLIDYRRIREALSGSEGPDVAFVGDDDLLFRRAPNAKWAGRPRTDMAAYFNLSFRVPQPLTFSTDDHGFRNLTTPVHADIALVGDSYVEGITVSDDETAAVRLQQLTGRPVANLAVAGYGTLQELVLLRKYAVPLHPKLVAWFFFEGNDLDDDQNFEDATAYQPSQPSTADVPAPVARPPAPYRWRGFVNRSFTRNAWLQMRQMTSWLVPSGLDTFGWFRDRSGRLEKMYFFDFYATRPFTDYEEARLAVTRTTLRQGLQIAREQGIHLVVIYIPIKFRVYGGVCTFPEGSVCAAWHPWDVESHLAAICRDEGIDFLSLTGPMRDAAKDGDLLYLPDDSHWNAAGHAFVARQLATVWNSIGH